MMSMEPCVPSVRGQGNDSLADGNSLHKFLRNAGIFIQQPEILLFRLSWASVLDPVSGPALLLGMRGGISFGLGTYLKTSKYAPCQNSNLCWKPSKCSIATCEREAHVCNSDGSCLQIVS